MVQVPYYIGALVQANTHRPGGWDDLFETNLPFFEPTTETIEEAEHLLTALKNRWSVSK